MSGQDIRVPPLVEAVPVLHRHRRLRAWSIIGLVALLLLVIALATTVGSVSVPLGTTIKIILSRLPFLGIRPDWQSTMTTIIWDIRLPRVVMAGIVGAALGTAGAAYQGMFRNPLADPYLIGVAQGAALGAVIGFLLPFKWAGGGFGAVPVMAFGGALISVVIVYSLARVGNTLPTTTLILAGVAIGALWGAVVSYLVINAGDQIQGILFWLMGSFALTQWSEVGAVLPYVVVGIAIILLYSRSLNIMQLDEEQAQQLGINVERVKIILLGAATLITAAGVAFVGIIGFVGIIIPHMVRLVWGPDHRFLLPLSVLTGAVFMIIADLGARVLLAPTELPIGVITAICGVPFFLYLLRRRRQAIFF